MSNLADKMLRMTVEEYLAWLEEQPERPRYELVDGIPIAMAPERAVHARIKGEAFVALRSAVERAGLDCVVFTDGMTVRADEFTAYEPDAVVVCGETIADDAIVLDRPVIIVEVLSPNTKHVDKGKKLAGYFAIASVRHYLIVDPVDKLIIHHERDATGAINTHIIREGRVLMAPPGIEIALTEVFAEL
jgi:Uma2 family endonuclease